MKFNQHDLDKLREIAQGAPRRIVIAGHTNPDGDAIGAALALREWLAGKGHEATCVVPNKYPYFLDWMPGIEHIGIFRCDDGTLAKKIEQAEVIFCVDFNMISRLEGLGESIIANKGAEFVLVDHHQNPPQSEFGVMFACTESSSTSFIVYKLIETLDGEQAISREMAEAMYVGMMTDTGNFSFSNLTPELFETVAQIVRKGVNIPQVNSNVYNSFTADRVKLLGYAISRMEILRTGDTRVAYMWLTERDMRKFNFQPGDSEGFVNYPLTIKSLSMSAMFIQTRKFIRVSIRTRGDVDANEFARKYFDGGGHKNAAGGKSFRSMTETVVYFRNCVDQYFGEEGCGCPAHYPEKHLEE